MRFSRVVIQGMLAAGLLSVGVGAHAQQTAAVNGTVRDAASTRPLLGAIVELSGPGGLRTTRTDETGGFSFSKVTPGSYSIVARRLGYEPARQTVDVKTGGGPVNILLTRVATLDTVRVRAAEQGIFGVVGTAHDLRPLPAATIQIAGLSGGRPRVDSTGHFFVPLKSAGVYVVRAQADGYETQTVSVTVRPNEGVEVALLLDSTTGPVSHMLAMAYADFDARLKVRRNASALVPRSELLRDGGGIMLGAIQRAPSFIAKSLRFGETACVFVDGRPRATMSLNGIDPEQVEAIEVYTASSEASGTLARAWPKGFPCADTGVPRVYASSDVVRWVVIWIKH